VIKSRAFVVAIFVGIGSAAGVLAQDKPASQAAPAKASWSGASTEDQNIKEYITLLRKDVRSQKSAVMNQMMQLDTDQSAKFWPLYRDYDAELTKLNDLRVANIMDYAKSYNNLTDAKADELIHSAMSYQNQRAELLANYYEKMKHELGAVTAARFLLVESQMLLIIDLQIDSALPIAGSTQN
jgi:hypothetical protein